MNRHQLMKWEVLKTETRFQGYFKINQHVVRIERFAGGHFELKREVFERGHAIAVLPYDPERDEVVLIEQFRVGAMCAGEYPWLIELIAGIIEKNETEEDVVRREALEEAGCELTRLIPVYKYLVSPGGASETQALYCALTSTVAMGGVFGLEEEGEDIKVHVVSREEALRMVETGSINNAMAMIALQWLALHYRDLQ